MTKPICERGKKKMKVDVMVNTYNSEKYLEQCLVNIYKNIPVRKLFVIDNFSEDYTVKIAEKFNAEIIQTKASLAEARAIGFKLVKTKLFVNVDSDVVLPSNWFNRVMNYWNNNKIGCIWGIPIHESALHRAYQTSMFKFRNPCAYHIPHLANMIARKDLLEDIVFPAQMKLGAVAGEDYWIMRWIEQKGFICKNVPVYCKHYSYPSPLGTKAFWGGASVRLLKRKKLHHLIRQVLLSFPQGVFTASISRNPYVIPYWVRYRFEELYGFLHWDKYFSLKRAFEIKKC